MLPERFELEYTGEDGQKHRPIMVHRVVYGSIERFIGILIENYAGAFPVWLAPVQIKILPITDAHAEFAYKLKEKFFNLGFRAEVDDRSEKTGKKIRDAQVKKIPYTIVIGDKEIETGVLPIRKHGEKDSVNMSTEDFISYVQEKISTRAEEYWHGKVAQKIFHDVCIVRDDFFSEFSKCKWTVAFDNESWQIRWGTAEKFGG